MMKLPLKLYCFIVLGLLMTACHYENEEELYPVNECDTNGVSFSTFVHPLLQDNCGQCHNASVPTAGISVEDYAAVIAAHNSGRFVGSIKHANGFSPMPQGAPKLSDCAIEKVEAWIADGAPDN